MRDFDGLRGLGGRGCRGGVRGVAIQRTSGCRGRVRGAKERKTRKDVRIPWVETRAPSSGPLARRSVSGHGDSSAKTQDVKGQSGPVTAGPDNESPSASRRRGCRGPAAGRAGPALAAGYFGPAACSAGPRAIRGRPDLDGREAGPASLPARLADAPGLARRRGKIAESRSLARFVASRNP